MHAAGSAPCGRAELSDARPACGKPVSGNNRLAPGARVTARLAVSASTAPDQPCLCCAPPSQPGALYLKQELAFRSTAAVGAKLHATVTATRVVGRRAVFDTRCVLDDGSGQVVVDGTALALLPAHS